MGPSVTEIKGVEDDTEVTFAPMDALADGLGGLDTSRVRPISEVARRGYNYFREGDVLLAKVTPCFENGKKAIASGLLNGLGYATSEVYVLRPNPDRMNTRFLFYLLCSEEFRAHALKSMTGAGGLRRISEDGVLNYRPKITDLSAQKALADFLDRETARINQLIEKKKRLVVLLKEKRSALITAAVTGTGAEGDGVPTVTGQFPQSLIKRHFDITLGKMLQPKSKNIGDECLPYLRAANIMWGHVVTDDIKKMWFSRTDKHKYALKKGDMVVLEGGDVGRSAILKEYTNFVGFQNSVHRVRAKNGNSIRFALYWMHHLKSYGYFDLVCSKATLAHFTAEKFAVTPFPELEYKTRRL